MDNTDISQIHSLLNNAKNIILSNLNMTSIRNKSDNLREIMKQNVDVLAVAETKIQVSFPSALIK